MKWPPHAHLVRTLVVRELTLRYRGSMLGWAWALIRPLVTVAVLSFVFGHVLGVRWPGAQATTYPVFLFSGLVVHGFLSDVIVRAPTLVTGNPNYVHKTTFPLAALAWIMICELLVPLVVGAVIVMAVALLLGFDLEATVLLAPLVLAPVVGYGLALGWLIAALGVYLRDLMHVTTLIATGMLFFSPVLYPLSSVPEFLQPFYYLNPTTAVVENFRAVALSGETPGAVALISPLAAATLIALCCYALFRRLEKGFVDVM